jgi:hypothetical protein
MDQKTLPSRKAPYKIYIEDNQECILEVKRKDHFFVYEVFKNGDHALLSSGPPFQSSEVPEHYYMDYLTTDSLNKIDLLTTNFNYDKVIARLSLVIQALERDYSFRDFNMDQANAFEDYQEILGQLLAFTGDEEYKDRHSRVSQFLDQYFYDRRSELEPEEKNEIISRLKLELAYLVSLGSN